jgi:type IV secretory pathway VirD2 relaxase
MIDDDDFVPRLGRMRAKGNGKRAKRFLSSILAAANRARGGGSATGRGARFDGSRIGRGASLGRLLSSRDRYAAFRQRRVIIKSRIVKLSGKGFAAARAHVRYVERDGTTREGGRGQLYGAELDKVDGAAFLDKGMDDRHHFRLIVSPEDGAEYDDLKSLTRRLMARVEEDLGTRLDWVAVDHFNTGHPHTHIIVRGKDDHGKDLIIARDYLTAGMRERAAELIDLDLGPRSIEAIRERLLVEVDQERMTSIDRALLREADRNILVSSTATDAFDQTVRIGRLRKLEKLGLAAPQGATHWRLVPNLADTLRRMGERDDIIRTMQRAFTARGAAPALADQLIYDPAAPSASPMIGRVIERGLADEMNDSHYVLVDATDGRTYYVGIGKGENFEALPPEAIVRICPASSAIRDADRTVATIAAANAGKYDIDAHLRHDPNASEAFAQGHVRRLEAMRRLTGGVTREPDGTWVIAKDHLDRAAQYEAARAKDRPVSIEMLSPLPIAKLVDVDAATWLDHELVAENPQPARDAGFGHDTREALARRRQWLMGQGLAHEEGKQTIYRAGMIQTLRRRELLRVGAQLSRELGMPFAETHPREKIEGVYRRRIDTMGGRYALIEKSREFTLVPWRPVLERQVGKAVAGMMRGDGINWDIGRGRSGPNIS